GEELRRLVGQGPHFGLGVVGEAGDQGGVDRVGLQTFSAGLSSGHLGGSTTSVMLSGTTRPAERCHPAWSTTSTACLPGATSAAISARCRFIASVLQAGRTSAAPLPLPGQIAPKM